MYDCATYLTTNFIPFATSVAAFAASSVSDVSHPSMPTVAAFVV
jgi:hypothetical protein